MSALGDFLVKYLGLLAKNLALPCFMAGAAILLACMYGVLRKAWCDEYADWIKILTILAAAFVVVDFARTAVARFSRPIADLLADYLMRQQFARLTIQEQSLITYCVLHDRQIFHAPQFSGSVGTLMTRGWVHSRGQGSHVSWPFRFYDQYWRLILRNRKMLERVQRSDDEEVKKIWMMMDRAKRTPSSYV